MQCIDDLRLHMMWKSTNVCIKRWNVTCVRWSRWQVVIELAHPRIDRESSVVIY